MSKENAAVLRARRRGWVTGDAASVHLSTNNYTTAGRACQTARQIGGDYAA